MKKIDMRKLRKILTAKNASIRWQCGCYIATVLGKDGVWREGPLHYTIQTERAAIEHVLCRLGVEHMVPDTKTWNYYFVLN